MARRYNVLFDFGEAQPTGDEDQAPDLITATPYAVMAVWRYMHPVTFDRQKQASFRTEVSDAIRLRSEVLIVTDDIRNLSAQHTKTNHVGQLNATLRPGMNYLTEIFPGDWCGAWMVYGVDKLLSLIDRLRKGHACNFFQDGLKFLGKVTAIRKRIQQQPDGHRNSSYLLNAASFTEFDAQLYYEPYLASQDPGLATEWLRKTGVAINHFIQQEGERGGIDIHKAIPLFLDAFYGAGVPRDKGFDPVDPRVRSTAGLDNPDALVLPDAVAAALGVKRGSKSNGKKGWTDVLEVLYGVQRYPQERGGAEGLFSPTGITTDPDTRKRETKDKMMGTFLPSPPQFNGQRTVWSILEQYLNRAVNEMYACLRANPNGSVFPTMVVRQLPFSSGMLDGTYRPKEVKVANEADDIAVGDNAVEMERARVWNKDTDSHYRRREAERRDKENADAVRQMNSPRNLVLTRFLELPRWLIHPAIIRGVDLGRSDALRFNFVHVAPETGLSSQNRTGYIVRDPPVRDDLDIARSGLRAYFQSVNCAPADALGRKAGEWMYILSDILMGQHLTLTGTMETVGIQSPICPGDNAEFDNHVLHLEAVSHTFNMSDDGHKSFTTMLAVSHGVKAEQADGGDLSLYTGSSQDDLRRYEAGQTREYGFSPTAPSLPQEGRSDEPKQDDPDPMQAVPETLRRR